MTTADLAGTATGNGGYADINGLHIYYERHGSGRPVVLLHGGLGSGEMFGPAVQALAAGHEVILPDLQGHGRTADIDRPIDPRLMAGDIAALIGHLGLDRPDIVGYSLGGGVSFWTAVDHPEVVRRMVMVSTNIKRSAIYPEMLAQQEQVGAAAVPYMVDTPMYQLYQRVAPRPDEFGRLLDKMGASMAVDFDFSDEVRGLRVPTLFVARRRRHVPAEPRGRSLRPARWRPARRRLDGARVGRRAATRWRSSRARPTTTSSGRH